MTSECCCGDSARRRRRLSNCVFACGSCAGEHSHARGQAGGGVRRAGGDHPPEEAGHCRQDQRVKGRQTEPRSVTLTHLSDAQWGLCKMWNIYKGLNAKRPVSRRPLYLDHSDTLLMVFLNTRTQLVSDAAPCEHQVDKWDGGADREPCHPLQEEEGFGLQLRERENCLCFILIGNKRVVVLSKTKGLYLYISGGELCWVEEKQLLCFWINDLIILLIREKQYSLFWGAGGSYPLLQLCHRKNSQ